MTGELLHLLQVGLQLLELHASHGEAQAGKFAHRNSVQFSRKNYLDILGSWVDLYERNYAQ